MLDKSAAPYLVLSYLEGDTMTSEETNLILATYKSSVSKKPLYRTIRTTVEPILNVETTLELTQPLISTSLTAKASLCAAVSYANDNDLYAKYFAVYKVYDLSVVLTHTKLLNLALINSRSKYVHSRTKNEKEVLVVGNTSVHAECVYVTSGKNVVFL